MSNYDLSILIPARQEMFLGKTILDILENSGPRTQVITVMDGEWIEGVPEHERVTVVYLQKSIGQRAATNLACKLSKAKWVAKTDAHCSFSKGFDEILMKDMQDDWTVVPLMRNLHAFDWVCPEGHRRYQGPSGPCIECGKPTTMDVLWKAKESPKSRSYLFDPEPHFDYHNSYTKTDEFKKGLLLGYLAVVVDCPDSLGIVERLTDFTRSHPLSSGFDLFRLRKKMPINTMGLPAVNHGRAIRPSEVLLIGDQLQVSGVTASSVLTEMIDNGNMFPSSARDGANEQGIGDPMGYCCFVDTRTYTVTPLKKGAIPIPAFGVRINAKTVHKFNEVLRGDFVYDEHITFFHNANIAIKPVYDNNITETMSIQGSFFMLTRKRYWELDICSEAFGSWGSQGIEISAKNWLTGGRVMCNAKTWYAHLFRTQGGDFGFPYPQDHARALETRAQAKDFFFKSKWKKQIYPLSFLLERFWPIIGKRSWTEGEYVAQQQEELRSKRSGIVSIENMITGKSHVFGADSIVAKSLEVERLLRENNYPEFQQEWNSHKETDFVWHVERFCRQRNLEGLVKEYQEKSFAGKLQHKRITWQPPKTKGILYYTDGELDEKIAAPVRDNILKAGLPITAVSLKPIEFGHRNIHLPLKRGALAMARQILSGLEAMDEDVVFYCEHDCIYPEKSGGHFEFDPPNKDIIYYNVNVYKIHMEKEYGLKVDDCRQLSGLCAYRETLIKHYRERVRRLEAGESATRMGFEPGTHRRKERVDDLKSDTWSSYVPILDLRTGLNLTKSRWKKEEFRNQKFTEGWVESELIPSWGKTSDILQYFKS